MRYIEDIRELIGSTPLIKINHISVKKSVNIFAKLETNNPGGSIKDRIGIYMIKDAEEKGLLKSGYTIIEPTAGNTGIGVALAAVNKGYNVIFVVPEKFSLEKQAIMRALGAKIVNTSREEGMLGAIAKAEELIKTMPNAISLRQFDNLQNPAAHYETTGPEIYKDLDGKIDYFVCGAGSGGTYTGIMKYLKEKNPNIKGILSDPKGSTIGGGLEGCYEIEGIGNNFMPRTMDVSLIDEVIKIADDEAFSMAREIALKEGILVGSSSGAALVAALKIAERVENANIVTLFADRGDRYISKGLY
ncbi:cysteine synthase A [Clostridium akagii]|uniref:cysteine synthase A n=1 Tax=Clostridium akagii TaxID=91623 RepID=UPI00047B8B84|nr:cysteine synthase A [Clostridium akagii]